MDVQVLFENRNGSIDLLIGMGMLFVYDFFRIMRRVVPRGAIWIAIEDFLYWVMQAFFFFFFFCYGRQGVIRSYEILGIFLGMLLYKKFFSNLYVNFMSTFLRKSLDIVFDLLSFPLNLVKIGILKAFRRTRMCVLGAKKKLTGNIKEFNIILCKHFYVNKSKKEHGE